MITKRHMGITLLVLGLTAVILVLAVDLVGAGAFSGMGPVQRLALVAGLVVTILGLSLVPFGNRPA
jgi:hypothetical protein